MPFKNKYLCTFPKKKVLLMSKSYSKMALTQLTMVKSILVGQPTSASRGGEFS